MGGAKELAEEVPKPPRPAYTPVYAFLARKQLKIKTLHPYLSSSDILVYSSLAFTLITACITKRAQFRQKSCHHLRLAQGEQEFQFTREDLLLRTMLIAVECKQALAKLNVAAEWEQLTAQEQDLYLQLADRKLSQNHAALGS